METIDHNNSNGEQGISITPGAQRFILTAAGWMKVTGIISIVYLGISILQGMSWMLQSLSYGWYSISSFFSMLTGMGVNVVLLIIAIKALSLSGQLHRAMNGKSSMETETAMRTLMATAKLFGIAVIIMVGAWLLGFIIGFFEGGFDYFRF